MTNDARSHQSIVMLRRTVGRAAWLDMLTDGEIQMIDREIISVFRDAMKRRGILPSYGDGGEASIAEQYSEWYWGNRGQNE